MSPTVLLATGNAEKLIELRRLSEAQQSGLTVLGLADVAAYDEPVEDQPTFEGNALIKARAAQSATGLPSLADDSGIEVDLLNRMPGVRSARWAGPQRDDDANNALLLAQLDDVPADARTARFVCAVALVLPDGTEHVERATMEGRLLSAPRGEHGFGYDPLFLPAGSDQTSAELTAAEKDAISHRGQAMRAILPVLVDLLAGATTSAGAGVEPAGKDGPDA